MPVIATPRAQPAIARQVAAQANPERAGGLVRQRVAAYNQAAAPVRPPRRVAARVVAPLQARPMHPALPINRQIPLAQPHRMGPVATPAARHSRDVLIHAAKNQPPVIAAKSPEAAQAVRQARLETGLAARATDTPAPTQSKVQSAEPAVEKHVKLSPRANDSLTRLIREHRQAKQAKAKTANAQNYIRLVAKGHFARDGKYRPATTYHIGVKTASGKPAPPTRYEYGRALERDGKTTGGFKHVAKQMEAGGWLLLEANDPSANLADAATVRAEELAGLPYVIATDFVDTNRAIVRNGGAVLSQMRKQGVRLHPDKFRGVVENLADMHGRGITSLDVKAENLAFSAKDNAVRMFDTDGLVRPHRLHILVHTPGYMPKELMQPIYDGKKMAFFTADEYAMLLTMIESSLTTKESNDRDFAQGYQAIFSKVPKERKLARNEKTQEMIDRWLARHVKPQYQKHAQQLLSDPLRYSQQRGPQKHNPILNRVERLYLKMKNQPAKPYPTLAQMLYG